ncbi:ribosome maturation factor RimM [Pelotomaculum propionicicum]|uniref:ribosome maturation factor RimM n=1 Tax=Pelotomaculum propionicicum TaxID=258475 RepID=UPI003B7D0327
MSEDYIAVGKILNTQGRTGAVRVLPLTDYPQRFKVKSRVYVSLKGSRKVMSIEESAPRQKYVIIKFKEVPDMNAAEEIKGGLLEITREDLYPLPENTYYIFDIIGLNVRDLNRGSLGRITDVLQTGANDVYIVETGARPLLIPALKQVVKEIDLPGRSMVVDLPDGLVDDEN